MISKLDKEKIPLSETERRFCVRIKLTTNNRASTMFHIILSRDIDLDQEFRGG